MKKIEVAVILGAGFGKRLTPITNEIPKPLVEIGNETILEKTIKLVKKLNLKKILINTHYKRDQLKNFIEKKLLCLDGIKIDYIEVTDTQNLVSVEKIQQDSLISLAVFFKKVRLIDNIEIKI